MSKRPGLILDRDGVINLDTGYLHRIEECRFVDGIFELAKDFRDRGFRIAIATNQSGIGRGFYGPAQFRVLMGWMLAQFRAHGVEIDAVYHAPEDPSVGPGSDWRKPGPGMLRQAVADLDLDPARSWAIGDKVGDMAAAAGAGIGYRLLLAPHPLSCTAGARAKARRSIREAGRVPNTRKGFGGAPRSGEGEGRAAGEAVGRLRTSPSSGSLRSPPFDTLGASPISHPDGYWVVPSLPAVSSLFER